MLIDMKNTSVHIVPIQDKDKEGHALPPKRHVRLMPGVNNVDDADWEKAKELAQVKYWISERECIELDSTPLAKRPPRDAVKIVKDTWNRIQLEKWREDDKRPQVQDAISQQIKALEPTADEKNKAGKGQEEA